MSVHRVHAGSPAPDSRRVHAPLRLHSNLGFRISVVQILELRHRFLPEDVDILFLSSDLTRVCLTKCWYIKKYIYIKEKSPAPRRVCVPSTCCGDDLTRADAPPMRQPAAPRGGSGEIANESSSTFWFKIKLQKDV